MITLLVWMVFAGVTIRFTKASAAFKQTLWRFHAQWYMFVAVLVLLIAALVWSLPNFPY